MSERDQAKGALYAQCIKELTLSDLIDLVCFKATMGGQLVKITVTQPPPDKSKGKKRGPEDGCKGGDY